jgi:hypothetical protein
MKLRYEVSPIERFWRQVDRSGGADECHEWTGARHGQGYGHFKAADTMHKAHRWLLGYLRGQPLRDGEFACHHCDNPPCCNSRHLYVGDHPRNMADMVARGRSRSPRAEANARKTRCARGHPFDAENTYEYGTARQCRTCNRLREAERRASGRAA